MYLEVQQHSHSKQYKLQTTLKRAGLLNEKPPPPAPTQKCTDINKPIPNINTSAIYTYIAGGNDSRIPNQYRNFFV